MNASSTDRIVKEITVKASRSRVWRALTDAAEFGEWFQARFDGPFVAGRKVRGESTHPSCSGVAFDAWIETVDPENLFSMRWHPHAVDPDTDYSAEPTTLVEFRLEDAGGGTRVIVTESGFDALPEERRTEAFIRNEGGWTAQMENIMSHLDG